MNNVDFIQDLAIVLAGAGLAGWVCRSLRLSPTIGYLLAGMVIGPYTPPFSLVFDAERIQVLSQIGLVFLMFAIGLNMSLRKLGHLGLPMFASAGLGVGLIVSLCRAAGWILEINLLQSMFLAGMLLVSSSAIIGKLLHETGFIHQRFGQVAMAITLVEDWAAMFMFGLLGVSTRMGEFAASSLAGTVGLFLAFMVVMAVASLLTVPRFLALLQRRAGIELQTIIVAGLLLLLALLAAKAGYSLALGAFLVGVVVSETAQREQIERSFTGVNDIFTAVFFVAIGMQIEVALFREIWPAMLAMAALAFVGRTAVYAVAQLAVGRGFNQALRVGLVLTPIGELSFIIALLGVSAGVLPKTYYPLVVGVCLLTTVAATLVVPHSEALARGAERALPGVLRRLLAAYQDLLARLSRRRSRGRFWRFARKRLLQIAVEMLFVSGILVFSETLGERLFAWLNPSPGASMFALTAYWTVISGVLLISMIAIWRNFSALALMFAQAVAPGQPGSPYALAVEHLTRIAGALLLTAWLWAVMPFRAQAGWVLAALAAVLAIIAAVFWRRMVYWHSVLEVRLDRVVRPPQPQPFRDKLTSAGDWNLEVGECVLPDHSRHSGKTLGELDIRSRFGATIAGIERQGELMMNPAAGTTLYPQDNLLIIGRRDTLEATRTFLQDREAGERTAAQIEDVHLETIEVPDGCPHCAEPIGRLNIAGAFGVQIVGLDRAGRKLLNPGAGERLMPGDTLLVLGTVDQVRGFGEWLRGDSG